MPSEVTQKMGTLVEATEAVSMIEVIARATRDPTVDIEKMERLMQLYERLESQRAEKAFNAALAACQAEIIRVVPDARNSHTQSVYATYAAIDHMLKPLYSRHGFALSFNEGKTEHPDRVVVVCQLSHSGGFSRFYSCDVPYPDKGAKGNAVMTPTQAHGAAKSYGQRYLVRGIFNIAIGEDEDGNNTGSEPSLTEQQTADLRALLEETKADLGSFLKWAKVPSVDRILQRNYKFVCDEVRTRGRMRGNS